MWPIKLKMLTIWSLQKSLLTPDSDYRDMTMKFFIFQIRPYHVNFFKVVFLLLEQTSTVFKREFLIILWP